MFNLLKKEYRGKNCYTPGDLLDLLGSHKQVDVVRCELETFKDWN
jgi:hypothetical protein